ncbi:hypothetical protein GE061_010671 [Apolygus lucorum]|uniref:Uncharacterized protein n=1 Tax=Apolygus lucorum TaxID=248454 RepID=A0A8S9XXF8_APOLU|nr:hypothetical protein GE061_010671 [Apolygus lucorum]
MEEVVLIKQEVVTEDELVKEEVESNSTVEDEVEAYPTIKQKVPIGDEDVEEEVENAGRVKEEVGECSIIKQKQSSNAEPEQSSNAGPVCDVPEFDVLQRSAEVQKWSEAGPSQPRSSGI